MRTSGLILLLLTLYLPRRYSFQFIEDCVRNEQVEDPERYLAAPHVQTPRPVGSSKPTKAQKTPFSAEDDRILLDWVTGCERNGFSVQGNKIYQLLEAKVRTSSSIPLTVRILKPCHSILITPSNHGVIAGSRRSSIMDMMLFSDLSRFGKRSPVEMGIMKKYRAFGLDSVLRRDIF